MTALVVYIKQAGDRQFIMTLRLFLGLETSHITFPAMECFPFQSEDEVKRSFRFFLFLATSSCVHLFPVKPSLKTKQTSSHITTENIKEGDQCSSHTMLTIYDVWLHWLMSLPSSVKSVPSVSGLVPLKREGRDAAAA